MFGGRKIKVNRIADEAVETVAEIKKSKPERAAYNVNENKDEIKITSYKQLEKRLDELYNISSVTIYEYDYRADFIEPKCVYGTKISKVVIEGYLSIKSPTVMRKATGLEDAPLYRARYISKYRVGSKEYLVILSSVRFEGFSVSELINIPVLIQNAIANIER